MFRLLLWATAVQVIASSDSILGSSADEYLPTLLSPPHLYLEKFKFVCEDGMSKEDCETEMAESELEIVGGALMMGAILPSGRLLTVLTILIVQVCFACLYQNSVTLRRPPFPDEASPHLPKDITVPLYVCIDCDCTACLYGIFCHTCRAADTYAAANVIGFWQVIAFGFAQPFIVAVLANLSCFIVIPAGDHESSHERAEWSDDYDAYFFLLFFIVHGMFFARQRQKLRWALGGHGPRGAGTAMADFISWCCLPCCTSIQEARQVDSVTGVRVSLCCNLTTIGYPKGQPLVGSPIVATSNIIMAQDSSSSSPPLIDSTGLHEGMDGL